MRRPPRAVARAQVSVDSGWVQDLPTRRGNVVNTREQFLTGNNRPRRSQARATRRRSFPPFAAFLRPLACASITARRNCEGFHAIYFAGNVCNIPSGAPGGASSIPCSSDRLSLEDWGRIGNGRAMMLAPRYGYRIGARGAAVLGRSARLLCPFLTSHPPLL